MGYGNIGYHQALQDFRRAQQQAVVEDVLARFTGRSTELLPFEEARTKLKGRATRQIGLQEIPLDAIIGSVGRYTDFTRTFLPLRTSDRERWAQVQYAITDLNQFAPIEVYQIGTAYFVMDGNHRVSIARQFGSDTISAYVTVVDTRVPLSPSDDADALILKAEYADFLEHTRLDEIRPAADLIVTLPGRYPEFEAQIADHHLYLTEQQAESVPYEIAVGDWYDKVYQPAIESIRERGILRDFPGRTEADLFIWLSRHRREIADAIGWEPPTNLVVSNLAAQESQQPGRILARVSGRLLHLLPDTLQGEAEAGQWRREEVEPRSGDSLFNDILVALAGTDVSWQAVDQAIVVAQAEGARLIGLHLVRPNTDTSQPEFAAMQARFDERCTAAGVAHTFAIRKAEQVALTLAELSRWSDMLVVNLAFPPGTTLLDRLRSGFRTLIRRTPRLILATPSHVTALQKALLAYDGSDKAQEALYVAAYMAGKWGTTLHIMAPALYEDEIAEYLEGHQLRYTFHVDRLPIGEGIVSIATANQCDVVLIGGYTSNVMREAVLGSTVDYILRASRIPTLICR